MAQHRCKRSGGFVDSNCMEPCDCHETLKIQECAWPDLREECANLQHLKNSHEERIAELEAQVEGAVRAIRRIDAINDSPACFNAEIDQLCRPFIRQGD